MKLAYRQPVSIPTQLECEGLIAASTDNIPIDPNKPGTAATHKRERIWGKTMWGDNH